VRRGRELSNHKFTPKNHSTHPTLATRTSKEKEVNHSKRIKLKAIELIV